MKKSCTAACDFLVQSLSMRSTIALYVILGALLAASPAMSALTNEDCLECHEDYKAYVHGSVSCADCHTGITELPHPEKLKKPACGDCHETAQTAFSKSVHGRHEMQCKECHAAHYVNKEKKYCASCHADVSHKSLPVKGIHLARLQCVACHASVTGSGIEVDVTLSGSKPVNKLVVDRDGNGIIDAKEWSFIQAFLEQQYKGKYKVNKRFMVKADVHGVAAQPAPCGDCHIDRKRFGKARLKSIGGTTYDISADPQLFLEEIPPIARYKETVHGKRGVICADCHVSAEKISDSVCINCHKDLFNLYKYSVHGTKNAARCTDCHNPHRIKSYKDLNAQERVAICARCHKNYISSHAWLPNTALHFHYLECSTCHSPESQKSMLFTFGRRTRQGESGLTYEEMKRLLPPGWEIGKALDKNGDQVVSSDELGNFFLQLREKLGKELYLDGSILVTKVYHNFTVTRHHEKECTACHSKGAPFYASMFLVVPEKEGLLYIPVKDTALSALPISLAIDMTLLGEEKLRAEDVRRLFRIGGMKGSALTEELGLKWIDLVGIALAILIFCFVVLHAVLRAVTRR
jgi:predicted CXXCH cytochrome family protein